MVGMKSLMRTMALRFGYEIRKAPSPNYKSVSVFDLAIHYLLRTRGHELTFIEAGANDGALGDPLRNYILKYSWRGVLIEPQPDVFEKLKVAYLEAGNRLAFENVAISNNPAPLELYRLPAGRFRKDDFPSTVASADQKVTARQLGVRPRDLEKIVVPTNRLDDIVKKYNLHDLDILQIDTEGLDWEVLQTINLTETRPRMIRFEHGHLSPKVIIRATNYLNNHGYDVNYGGNESDTVALRSDFICS